MAWETRVLVSPSVENGSLTVLSRPRFSPIGLDDVDNLPRPPSLSEDRAGHSRLWRGLATILVQSAAVTAREGRLEAYRRTRMDQVREHAMLEEWLRLIEARLRAGQVIADQESSALF
ncbi:hypothetical protein [Kitasatospora phosalacinea]|uniref:Uncharacterized protein n=1 Tax=Kitasatospora phosalacinea TaxID=2065 RepID=A0ABW6GTX7_9ACTN